MPLTNQNQTRQQPLAQGIQNGLSSAVASGVNDFPQSVSSIGQTSNLQTEHVVSKAMASFVLPRPYPFLISYMSPNFPLTSYLSMRLPKPLIALSYSIHIIVSSRVSVRSNGLGRGFMNWCSILHLLDCVPCSHFLPDNVLLFLLSYGIVDLDTLVWPN